jgi:hypothetical protein
MVGVDFHPDSWTANFYTEIFEKPTRVSERRHGRAHWELHELDTAALILLDLCNGTFWVQRGAAGRGREFSIFIKKL